MRYFGSRWFFSAIFWPAMFWPRDVLTCDVMSAMKCSAMKCPRCYVMEPIIGDDFNGDCAGVQLIIIRCIRWIVNWYWDSSLEDVGGWGSVREVDGWNWVSVRGVDIKRLHIKSGSTSLLPLFYFQNLYLLNITTTLAEEALVEEVILIA